MRRWDWMIGLAFLVALAIACGIAKRVIIAKAVLPPHVTRFEILKTVLNPPYQMAAPHHSLLELARGFFMPTVVHALTCGGGGGVSPCAYLKAMPLCNPNCTSGCYCPDCLNLSGTNCTIWHCVASTNQSDTCDDSYTSCNGACQNVGACRR